MYKVERFSDWLNVAFLPDKTVIKLRMGAFDESIALALALRPSNPQILSQLSDSNRRPFHYE